MTRTLMHSPLVSRLDTQAAWRSSLDRQVAAYARFLADHDLGAAGDDARLEALRHRLLADRLMLAFVAETVPGSCGVLVKRAKPGQDLRVDMPVIGPDTVARAAAAGLSGIELQAGHVLLLDPPSVRDACAARGLNLWAVP